VPVFATPEWLGAYKDAINSSPEIAEAAKDWHDRDIAIVVESEPGKNVPIDLAALFEIEHGVCKAATIVSPEEANRATFTISAPYSRWKEVVQGKLDPIRGMLQGKLQVTGDLPTLAREVQAAKALVSLASSVTSSFPDERSE
jgi:putative sterol carrier protein